MRAILYVTLTNVYEQKNGIYCYDMTRKCRVMYISLIFCYIS